MGRRDSLTSGSPARWGGQPLQDAFLHIFLRSLAPMPTPGLGHVRRPVWPPRRSRSRMMVLASASCSVRAPVAGHAQEGLVGGVRVVERAVHIVQRGHLGGRVQRPLISRLHPGRHAGRVERVMPHEVRQQGQQFGVAGDAASHGQQGGVAGQRVAQLIGADPGPVFQEGLHLFVRKAVLVVQDGQEDQAAQDVFGQGLLRLTAGNRLPERIGQSLDALDDADVGQTGGLGRGDDRLAVRASWRQAQSAGIGRRGPQVDLRVQAFLPHGAPFLALVGAQFFLVVDQQHRAALALSAST